MELGHVCAIRIISLYNEMENWQGKQTGTIFYIKSLFDFSYDETHRAPL